MEDAHQKTYNTLETEMGIEVAWVDEMLKSVSDIRTTLKLACGGEHAQEFLLTLTSLEDVVKFKTAVDTFSSSARAWLMICAEYMVKQFEAKTSQTIPNFTLCGFGSFGRAEMGPFSDLDAVILCDSIHIKTVEEAFAMKLAKAASLMRSLVAPNDALAACFTVSFELSSMVMTPEDLATTVGSPGAIPDVFSIWDHGAVEPKFLDRYYAEVGKGSSRKALCGLVNRAGLDGLFTSRSYDMYSWQKGRGKCNVKNVAAFFQRAVAVCEILAKGHNSVDDLPSATEKRLKRYNYTADENESVLLYFQVLAVRYASHFGAGKEVDEVDNKEGTDNNIKLMYQRVIELELLDENLSLLHKKLKDLKLD